MALGQDPREAFYFLSAGADLDIGTATYRKKELWPVDIRQRAHVTGLSEDIEAITEDDPSSGLLNFPGLSWELGPLLNLSESGAYRETLIYGQSVTEHNWEHLAGQRGGEGWLQAATVDGHALGDPLVLAAPPGQPEPRPGSP